MDTPVAFAGVGSAAAGSPSPSLSSEPAPRPPSRIQRKRTKGWQMPAGAVYVGRPTIWGNPFNFRASEHCWTALAFGCRADPAGRQKASVVAYREWVTPQPGRRLVRMERQAGFGDEDNFLPIAPRIVADTPPSIEEIRAELGGKDLACWCPLDAPCHADVLLELANKPEESE